VSPRTVVSPRVEVSPRTESVRGEVITESNIKASYDEKEINEREEARLNKILAKKGSISWTPTPLESPKYEEKKNTDIERIARERETNEAAEALKKNGATD